MNEENSPKKPEEPPENDAPDPMGEGYTLGINILVSVLVGLAVGYGLDSWLGTRPWLMVVFIFLGFAAGVRTAWKYLDR